MLWTLSVYLAVSVQTNEEMVFFRPWIPDGVWGFVHIIGSRLQNLVQECNIIEVWGYKEVFGGRGEWHVVVDMQLVRFLDWKEVVEVALKAYRPFSQERLRTLPQRASDTVDLRWFLFDESYQCLWQPSPSQDLQFWTSHFSSINFYLKPEMANWSCCWYQARRNL